MAGGVFERTAPDYDNTHTIHKAGCGHLRRARAIDPYLVIPVEATDLDAAITEALADEVASGNPDADYKVAPCARKASR